MRWLRSGTRRARGSSFATFVRAGLTSSRRRQVVGVALGLWLVDLVAGLFGWRLPPVVGVPARVVLALAAAWLVWRALRWFSERLLWRIRTKLILSYLFIALVPVLLMTAFATIAGVLLLGLVGARVVTGEIERAGDVMRVTVQSALVDLPPADAEVVGTLPARLAAIRELQSGLAYALVRRGRVVAATGDAPHEVPGWLRPGTCVAGLVAVRPEQRMSPEVLRAGCVRGDAALLVQVPADPLFYAGIERRTGIHVIQSPLSEGGPPGQDASLRVESGSALESKDAGTRVRAQADGGFAWFALPEKTNWTTGERSVGQWLPVAFRYQPMDIVRRLSPASLRELGMHTMPEFLLYLLGILGAAFVGLYGFALVLGALLARQITRGVHDLTLGTERLRQGDFSHLIRIRSRDQLGELAESFNLMSRSLKALIQEQSERQRLEEELRIARQIQMSLLPGDGLVQLPGIRVSALCLPAAEVGGDYYDLLPLGANRMGVLVADVSGKGTSAALYMAELKGLVLSLSRIHSSPAQLLVEANRILSANMESRSFVTMTYGIVDTAARRMRYARAGHNPLIHLEGRTRTTRVLAPPGLGLGLDPGERFERILEEAEVPIEPGDVFLFFTDGLSEAMNAGAELFGEARLQRILEQAEGLESEQMKERILAEVRRFVGDAPPQDDLTLVLIEAVAEGDQA